VRFKIRLQWLFTATFTGANSNESSKVKTNNQLLFTGINLVFGVNNVTYK
tara:strand:+ start:197204 stop:197353 length:150 start_codon:yes stop_codon:yes gene_type:complete